MKWELVSKPLLFSSRIVSNRYAPLPFPGADDPYAPSTIRQMVVRISSRQRLTIERDEDVETERRRALESLAWSPDGTTASSRAADLDVEAVESVVQEEPVEKNVVEYIVLQKKMVKGTDEPWKVWGFANKTTWEKMEADNKADADMMAYEAAHPTA